MWGNFQINGRNVVAIFTEDGWSAMLTKSFYTEDKGVWFYVTAPDDGNVKLDTNRPPFVFCGEELVLDCGAALRMELITAKTSEAATVFPEFYDALDDRMGARIWHGKAAEGKSIFINHLLAANQITVQLFILPFGNKPIKFPMQGFSTTLRNSFPEYFS